MLQPEQQICNGSNAETHRKLQSFLVKPDIKKWAKCVKHCQLYHVLFYNIIFHINCYLSSNMISYYFKINKYLKDFLVLVSYMVNINSIAHREGGCPGLLTNF